VFHVLVFETARNALPEVFRDYALDACADVEGCAGERPRAERTAGLPPAAVTVTIARCPENDGWRTITIEGGEAL